MRKTDRSLAIALLLGTLAACATPTWRPLDDADAKLVRHEVAAMMARIPVDLANEGPQAWRKHLLDDASFFMAAYGDLHLRNGEHTTHFLRELAPKMARVELAWREIRVEPLSSMLAAISAGYDDLDVMTDGKEERFSGWFTGVATRTAEGWRLSHAHWSSPITPHVSGS